MCKKWTAKIVILTALAALYLAMGTAVYAETTGDLTETISYVLDDNGNLTITGKGASKDYQNWSDGSNPFNGSTEIKTVTIGEGITRIGSNTFYNCRNLKKAILPNSLVSIGDYAFYENTQLREVNIPKNVIEIGEGAFVDCLLLKSVTVSGSIQSIGEYAFGECFGLDEIHFKGDAPENILKSYTFYGCDIIAYYPLGNTTWSEEILDCGLGGKIKWVGVCSHAAGAAVTENRKEPTVFAAGSYDTVVRCKHCGQEMSRKTTTIEKLKPTIKLSAKKKTLKKKKTYTLKVTGLAKGDSVKSFKSSKKGVATVTKKGKIRAIKKGKAVITVTLKSGKTAKCKITVK